MFILLLIIHLVQSSMNPSNGWSIEAIKLSRPILNAINNERKNIDLYEINYDFQFEQFLNDTFSNDFYSQKSNKSSSFPLVGNLNNTISINAYYLMDLPIMKYFSRYGYKYAFHYPKKQKLKNLIAKARACYDPWKCSRNPPLNNFISCFDNSKECFGTNRIYPYIYLRSFSRISCKESGNFIVCFGRFNRPKTAVPWDSNDDYE